MLLLYEKIYINIVKTFQERDKMENHKTRENMDSYNHLLRFARGVYMPTLTLLNGRLCNGSLKILLFNAYQSHYFGLTPLFSIACIFVLHYCQPPGWDFLAGIIPQIWLRSAVLLVRL